MANQDKTEEAEVVTEGEIVEYGQGSRTDVAAAIQGLNNPDAAFFSSIKTDTFAGRINVGKALSNSQPIADNLGVEIALKDFVVQSVQIEDEKTGEVNEAPRVTLVDADGNAFHGTSVGLLSAVRNLIAQIGEPSTWDEPVNVKIVEERSRRGFRFMTIKLV